MAKKKITLDEWKIAARDWNKRNGAKFRKALHDGDASTVRAMLTEDPPPPPPTIP